MVTVKVTVFRGTDSWAKTDEQMNNNEIVVQILISGVFLNIYVKNF